MVGTVLKGDLQSSIEDQLQQYARGVGSAVGVAQQAVGDTWEDLQRAGRTGVQDVQAQLADYATQAYNASQEAQRQAQEEAQRRAEQAAQVEQELTAHANQALAGVQQQAPQAGAPVQAALPHSEEPGTATDVGGGSDLGKNWKTQFDFGATYTGDYRTGTPHRGVDLVPSSGKGIGTEVDAFVPGTVTNVSRDSGAGGLMVYVQDADGLTHAYMHLANSNVNVGDQVQRGQPIAQMGESGTEGSPHLHYEVRKNAASGDPLDQLVDPRPYLNGSKQPGGGGPIQAARQAVTGAVGNANEALDRNGVVTYVKQKAREYGLDPAAVLAVANQEGLNTDPGSHWQLPGERNISFGPPSWYGNGAGADILAKHGDDAARWSWTPEGLDYWLAQVARAKGTVGATGSDAINAIVTNFERPREDLVAGEISKAQQQYANFVGDVQGVVGSAAGAVQGAVGGAVAGARRATGDVIQAGEQAATAARAPIYGTLAGGRDQAVQQLNVLQSQIDSLRDQLAGAPEGARQAIAGAAEPLIAGAQQLGRQVGPNLGFDDAELQRRRGIVAAQQPPPPEQGPGGTDYSTPQGIAGGAARAVLGGEAFGTVTSQAQRQRAVEETQRGFAAVSPTTTWGPDVRLPGAAPEEPPTHVGGALIQGLVDQVIQNPLLFVPGAPMGEAFNTVGGRVLQEFLPQLGGTASRLGAAAINGAVQNAVYEMGQPNATPQSIGAQFLAGAGFGAALHGSTELAGAVGRRLLDHAPDLARLARTRQRGEVDLGLITTGEPTPREAPTVEVTRLPEVPRGTIPESRVAPRTGLPSEEVAAGGSFRLPGETIKDATLRNLRETGLAQAGEVGPRVLGTAQDSPEYLQGVVQFLGEQRQKILAGELTPRDVVKAYLSTMSSIRGRAAPRDVIASRAERAGFGLEPGAESRIGGRAVVRPEDAFASWLLSPEGRSSLDQLERGDLSPARPGGPIDTLRGKAQQGGLGYGQPMLKPEMLTSPPRPGEFNLTNIAALTDAFNAAGRSGNIDEALRLAGHMKGVGTAKEGFVAHLLGLGDAPTVDTNELKIWLGQRSPELQANVERSFGTKGSPAAVETRNQLMQRFNDLRAQGYGTDIPPDAFQHVMHHWLFDRALGAETTHAALYRAQQRAQANVPFTANLGGAAFGGYAGNLATPSDASPEQRAKNIAAGAAAGFGGTHLITRGLGGRLAPEAAGRPTLEAQLAARPAEGFRAPGRPEGPELRATTQEPPGGPVGAAPPGREPRTLGEVHSNPHLLNEPRPGETPLTDEELSAHYEQLDTRNQQVQARLDAVDEMLRNPNQKVERPPWAAGLTNLQVAEVARRADISPYEPLWWEKVGMESGSGEVRDALREGGAFSAGQSQRELTPTELRAERNTLATERRDIQAAADQLGSAPAGTRFTRRAQDAARLPFDVGSEEAAPHGPFATENQGSSGVLAEDIVTRNGTAKRPSGLSGLWSQEGQVGARGERGGRTVTGMGITDAEAAGVGEPTRITRELMPNLDAMLGDDMPEVRAQMQRVVENNQELFAAYQQGRISMASLRDDLARKVGLSKAEWLKTPIGKAYNERELMALQAVAVDASVGANDLAHDIVAKGGVDALTPEEVAFGLANMLDASHILAVARGGRSTAGRSLNALKQRMNATLARGITASNERISAERLRDQAKRAAVRATQLLNKTRDLDAEARQAVAGARERGAPRNVLQQIEDAYAQLDRYQAMSLHEKGEEFTRLAKERAERAAARKAQVREAPQELLSALRAELKAEQDNFAKRKDTWETMAFWDTKANENAVTKRNAFRGGLYIEQARKAANIAAKEAETERARAFDSELRRKSVMTERASRILEAIGGEKPSRDLLRSFTEAVAADDPMVAAKFLKGLSAAPQGKFAKIVEIVRNSNVMRLAGMLAATATHMANATGNAVQVPLELTTHAATIGIDVARSKITGGPRQAYAAELPAMLQSYGPGFLTHLPDAMRLMQTGVSPVELADLSKLRPGFRSGLPGRAGAVVDPAIEMPLRTLQASDVLFRGGAYAMHANRVATRRATQEGYRGAQRAGRASNIVENLEDYPELYKEASDAAARMVYQERRTIPGLGGIRQATPGAELARVGVSQVLPFKTTPANIFSQGLGLSPLGAIGTLEAMGSRGGIAQRVEAGALPRERLDRQTLLAEERAARTLIGTAILGAGLWVGSQTDAAGKPKGMLTAMYDENEASTYPQGWRAWSMRLENPKDGSIDYVPLQNFGAAGVPLAMAAILTDAGRRGKTVMDGQELTRAVTGLGRYAIDNTFLQGVSDWVDALHDPGRAGSKAVEGLVASYGPYSGMGRQIQRAYGVASRNPREGLQALVDAMEANYPGLSGNVPEATTALGEARTPGQTGVGAFIAPVRYDVERDEPTLRALRENDVRVPPAPKVISVGNGWAIDLSEAEQDQLKRARGAAIRDEVAYVLASPRYKQAVRDNDVGYRNQLLAQAVSNAAQNSNIDFQRGMTKEELQARAKRKAAPEPYILGSSAAD